MGEHTEIAWTDATFNPWWGCQRVSPGCEHCYAEAFAKRTGHAVWGPTAGRRFFGDSHWAEPLKWNAAAEKAGARSRVFCASMADVFEKIRDVDLGGRLWDERTRLFSLIQSTPWLDWQLLTKRPQNVMDLVPDTWHRRGFPSNVWIGTTVEDQLRADERIPMLMKIPARTRFLSCEPLLGHVVLRAPGCIPLDGRGCGIDWVIIGGESGGGARMFDLDWARSLIRQCTVIRVPVFVKQMGARPMAMPPPTRGWIPVKLLNRKGADMAEWPADLQVRQFPADVRIRNPGLSPGFDLTREPS